jgi:hypothetical protein
MVVEFADRVGQAPEPMRLPPPSPSAISQMEEVLTWLRCLEVEDAKLVWARADLTPWKVICWQFGVARATGHRRWQYGLSGIAWRLNGGRVPGKQSRRFIVERVNAHRCRTVSLINALRCSKLTGISSRDLGVPVL